MIHRYGISWAGERIFGGIPKAALFFFFIEVVMKKLVTSFSLLSEFSLR